MSLLISKYFNLLLILQSCLERSSLEAETCHSGHQPPVNLLFQAQLLRIDAFHYFRSLRAAFRKLIPASCFQ